MNYELFRKGMVSLALMCVIAFSTLVGNVVPANAQGYPRQYVYSYPYVYSPNYQPYIYYPQGYYPIVDHYPYSAYPYGYYPYDYDKHHHHHWHEGRHHIKRALDWLF